MGLFKKRRATSIVLSRCQWTSVGCWHHDDDLGSTEVAHFVQLHEDGSREALEDGGAGLLRAASRNASPRGFRFVRELAVLGGEIERVGGSESLVLNVPPLPADKNYEEVRSEVTHIVRTTGDDMRINVQLALLPDSGSAPLEGPPPQNVVHFRPPSYAKETCPCCLVSFRT